MKQPTFTPHSPVKIEGDKGAEAQKDLILINKSDFAVKNLTSNLVRGGAENATLYKDFLKFFASWTLMKVI